MKRWTIVLVIVGLAAGIWFMSRDADTLGALRKMHGRAASDKR